jgi:SET domain
VPVIKNLTANYSPGYPVEFSYTRDIETPIFLLFCMGIDVFKEPEFDTWVIMTIFHRLRINMWEDNDANGVHWQGLSSLYSLFNHHCEPNVEWEKSRTDSSIVMTTKRQIMEGEELCISYLNDENLKLSHTERQEKLATWFRECGCGKCRRSRNKKRKRESTESEKSEESEETEESGDSEDSIEPPEAWLEKHDPDDESDDDYTDD